jgi:hypothetical protein
VSGSISLLVAFTKFMAPIPSGSRGGVYHRVDHAPVAQGHPAGSVRDAHRRCGYRSGALWYHLPLAAASVPSTPGRSS